MGLLSAVLWLVTHASARRWAGASVVPPEAQNIYWMAAPYTEHRARLGGFVFWPDGRAHVYDGCNTEFMSYAVEEGTLILRDSHTTAVYCFDVLLFAPHLAQSVAMRVKDDRLFIDHKDGTRDVYFAAGTRSLRGHPLGGARWELIKSNDPHHDKIEAAGRLPVLVFDEDRGFLLNHDKDKRDLIANNFDAGLVNLGETAIFFYTTSAKGSLTDDLPGGEDATLATHLLNCSRYSLDDGNLTIRDNTHWFTFARAQ